MQYAVLVCIFLLGVAAKPPKRPPVNAASSPAIQKTVDDFFKPSRETADQTPTAGSTSHFIRNTAGTSADVPSTITRQNLDLSPGLGQNIVTSKQIGLIIRDADVSKDAVASPPRKILSIGVQEPGKNNDPIVLQLPQPKDNLPTIAGQPLPSLKHKVAPRVQDDTGPPSHVQYDRLLKRSDIVVGTTIEIPRFRRKPKYPPTFKLTAVRYDPRTQRWLFAIEGRADRPAGIGLVLNRLYNGGKSAQITEEVYKEWNLRLDPPKRDIDGKFLEIDLPTDIAEMKYVQIGDVRLVYGQEVVLKELSSHELIWQFGTRTSTMNSWVNTRLYLDPSNKHFVDFDIRNGIYHYKENSEAAVDLGFAGWKVKGEYYDVPGYDVALKIKTIHTHSIIYTVRLKNGQESDEGFSFGAWVGKNEYYTEVAARWQLNDNKPPKYTITRPPHISDTCFRILGMGPPSCDRWAYVYLMRIEGGRHNNFKIGLSKNPTQRLAALSSATKQKHQLVYYKETPYGMLTEKLVHVSLKGDADYTHTGHGRTEWFNVDQQKATALIEEFAGIVQEMYEKRTYRLDPLDSKDSLVEP